MFPAPDARRETASFYKQHTSYHILCENTKDFCITVPALFDLNIIVCYNNGTMKKNKLKVIITILLSLSTCLLSGCTSNKQVQRSGFYFDTIITITLYGTDDASYIDHCFTMAETYENLFSNTVEGSDISEINAHAGEYVKVSDETVSLIRTGIRYGEISRGRFDITLGKLSELWNFSEIAENLDDEDNEADESVLPDADTIAALLPHINDQNILIDGNKICLKDKDAKLDLGGIAKGYIADRMKEYLTGAGVRSGLINLGGNVLTLGEKSDGSAYTIGIQKPFSGNGEIMGTVKVTDQTVVTSGVYERYYRIDGKLYHHILDLSTGYPYENGLYGVTIICDDSVDADALSTTCFALGLEEGLKLIESLPDTEAIFIDSNYDVHPSSGIGSEIAFEAN